MTTDVYQMGSQTLVVYGPPKIQLILSKKFNLKPLKKEVGNINRHWYEKVHEIPMDIYGTQIEGVQVLVTDKS